MEVKRGDLTGQAIGRYQVEDFLDGGGMGRVYKAYDSMLRRSVAIKRLDPELSSSEESRRSLLQEAQNAACLSHQSIAAVHDVVEWGDELLLVMEYVEGVSLAEASRPVPLEAFLDYATQCASALVAAHDKGIVHRDIKPGNIMLTRGGKQVKVLDFGIAKRLGTFASDAATCVGEPTSRNRVKGTLGYMAPEVLTGSRADGRCDIFSLGVVFYELLTAHHPFQETSAAGTIDRILHAQPCPVERLNPAVSPDLSRIVEKMLEKSPEDRYATAKDLLVDLRKLQRNQSRTLTIDPVLQPPRKPLGLGWFLIPALLGAILLVPLRHGLRDWFVEWFVPLPEIRTVAILPFQAPGASEPDQALAAGLSEELRRMLAQSGSESGVHYAPVELLREAGVFAESNGVDFDAMAEAAAKEAGATLALAGTLKFEAESLHVDLELLEAHFHAKGTGHSGHRLRRRQFTMENPSLFAWLNRLRSETLAALEVESSSELSASPFRYGTFKPNAYVVFLRGLGYLVHPGSESRSHALEQLEMAVMIDSRFARARAFLGKALLERGEATEDVGAREDARAACEAAVRLERDLAEGHLCLAQMALAEGDSEKALQALKDAYMLEPLNEEIVEQLGKTRIELEQKGLARQVFQLAIEREPRYWRYHYLLGDCLYDESRFAETIPAWEKAASLAPSSWKAFRDLGVGYAREARFNEAREALEKAREIGPVDLDRLGGILNDLATAYFFSGRLTEAVRAYEAAMAESKEVRYDRVANFADALYWSGDKERARELYKEAFVLAGKELVEDPDNIKALRFQAKCTAMLGDGPGALRLLDELLERAPQEPLNMQAAAEVNNFLGEREATLAWLEHALEGGIHEAEIRNHPIFESLAGDPLYEALFQKGESLSSGNR